MKSANLLQDALTARKAIEICYQAILKIVRKDPSFAPLLTQMQALKKLVNNLVINLEQQVKKEEQQINDLYAF